MRVVNRSRALQPYPTCFMRVPSSTLCSTVIPRRAAVQLNLAFLEIPHPSALVLETLDETQRAAALDVLARLIVKAIQLKLNPEGDDHD